jgi:DNA-binding NarL/FixJ family response regulator
VIVSFVPDRGVAGDVLLVEDDLRYSAVVTQLLAGSFASVRHASNGKAALARVEERIPQAVVLDLGLPDCDGIELVSELMARGVGPILVLSGARSPVSILDALRAGAAGYLLKEDAARSLLSSLRELLSGGSPLSAEAAKVVVSSLRGVSAPNAKQSAEPLPGRALTRREAHVLEQLARGLSYEQIAGLLELSVNTVRTHVKSIYEKLEASTRTEALLTARRCGLLRDEGPL